MSSRQDWRSKRSVRFDLMVDFIGRMSLEVELDHVVKVGLSRVSGATCSKFTADPDLHR